MQLSRRYLHATMCFDNILLSVNHISRTFVVSAFVMFLLQLL